MIFWGIIYILYSSICLAAIKRKKKAEDLPSDILAILSKVDEQAEARMEERERKRMLLNAELEERRREQERKHEERMQTMFGFMHQMMQSSASPRFHYAPHTSFPPCCLTPLLHHPQLLSPIHLKLKPLIPVLLFPLWLLTPLLHHPLLFRHPTRTQTQMNNELLCNYWKNTVYVQVYIIIIYCEECKCCMMASRTRDASVPMGLVNSGADESWCSSAVHS